MLDSNLTLVVIMLVFILFMFYSNKKRKDAATKLSNSVVVGAKVVMLGGITGKVVSITDETVVIESTPGNKIEFVKAAVRSAVAPSVEDAPADKAKPKTTAKKSETTPKKTAK